MRARTAVVAVLSALAMTAPPSGAAASGVGTASRYGLTKGFQLVGHTDLGRRAMNSPLAVAGRCAYVGDRYYSTSRAQAGRPHGGIAVVDVHDPRHPVQRGLIPPVAESTQRELRADAGLGVLVVLSYSPFAGGDPQASQPINTLKVYDIHRDCLRPKLLSTYDFGPRPPHEFFLWKDPKHPGRALAYVTFTVFSPDLMVLDLADPAKPTLAGVYDLGIDQLQKTIDFVDESGSGYTHSLSVSDDGTRAYMAGWDYGFWTLDTSMLADPPVAGIGLAHPVGIGVLDTGHNVHSAAVVPGRRSVVLTQEDYAAAGHGCPFGVLRTGRLTADGGASLAGQFSLPENDPRTCGTKNGTFSSHNPTLFHDVALLTWYSGGLRAVDLTDPAHPFETGAFVPRPTFEPELRDARLFFPRTAQKAGPLPTDSTWPGSRAEPWIGSMWSYPVVQNGLVYVVDIDLGLYVLRYTGKHASEVARAPFVEGNSSPSRYTASAPRIVRPPSQWRTVARDTAAGPTTVLSPYRVADREALHAHGFICL
ncbi:MAG TPA: hypothetical protein VMZ11_09305 [Mycobacteriales bacterium]|nr:hypothetical protein [Mycobacteriales bacterium]